MDKQKWMIVIVMMFLIMSSLYVGAFISKHKNTKDKPTYVHEYRGREHTIHKVYPETKRIRVWPFVDIEYNAQR